MQAIEGILADVARTEIPILLLGECGTGKDVLAQEIHRRSRHEREDFSKVSGAGLTVESLHALLSGLDDANGNGHPLTQPGTLFLDEICDLDPACQSRLLAVLPDGTAALAGAADPVLRARLVCSSSRNIEEQLRTGRLRQELYFRMNGVCLRIPPLRCRREDIPVLLDFFLEKHAQELNRSRPAVGPSVLQAVLHYPWPGNVRELENFARRLVLLGDVEAVLAELGSGPELATATKENGNHVSLKEAARAASRHAERELILKTLTRTRWNRKKAAQELQISYKALLYKLKDIGVEESDSHPGKES